MKIIDFATNFFIFVGLLWVIYRVVTSFEFGLINGMIHIVVLVAFTWTTTYYINMKK